VPSPVCGVASFGYKHEGKDEIVVLGGNTNNWEFIGSEVYLIEENETS